MNSLLCTGALMASLTAQNTVSLLSHREINIDRCVCVSVREGEHICSDMHTIYPMCIC